MQINVKILLLFVLLIAGNFSFAGNEQDLPAPAPRFTENKGQWHENVLYKLKMANAHLYLEQDKFTWVFYDPEFLESIHSHNHTYTGEADNAFAYRVNFAGANPQAQTTGEGAYADYSNYFIGNDTTRWASNVNSFNKVHYDELYAGVDMDIYESGGLLKYDFTLQPGVSSGVIQMTYDKVDNLYIENGKLMVRNPFNTVIEHQPVAWQVINGTKKYITCGFKLDGNTVSFNFPDGYDSNYGLVIDPVLEFSTYTGSLVDNWGFTATYNTNGNLFAGGIAFGTGYPTTVGSYQTGFSGGVPNVYLDGTDISITKYAVDGSSMVYSTYLGGTNNELPYSMIVNGQDELFVFGSTGSTDFPTTTGAYDRTYNGGTATSLDNNSIGYPTGSDIFVSHLNANGSALIGSTLIGGSDNDGLNETLPLNYNYADHARGEIILDNAGNPLVGSCTFSTNFPTTNGVFQPSNNGGQDGVVFKMNAALTALTWSTHLGGSNQDASYSLKLDNTGKLFVSGGTASTNFPTTLGVLFQTYRGGSADGFITSFNANAGTIIRSSFIGTNQYDQSFFVEIDANDNVYLYGQTLGAYPITNGVYSNTGGKQFIHKLDNGLAATQFSTVFGSGGPDINISPTAFLVDVCGKIYMAGWGGNVNTSYALGANLGSTNNMPVTLNAYQSTTDGSDFYFMVLEANAAALLYGTYFGGNGTDEHVDGGTSRFDKNGIIYEAVCAGCGSSDLFPTTPGVVSNTNGSNNCNLGSIKFRIQLSTVDVDVQVDNGPTSGCAPFTVNLLSNGVNAQGYIWDFGDGSPTSTATNPTHIYQNQGTYTVMLIGYDSTSCLGLVFMDTSYATITVQNATFALSAGSNSTVCAGTGVQLGQAPTPGLTYQWNPATGLSNPNIANPIANPTVTTTYILSGTNSGGCVNRDTVLVTVFGVTALQDTTICPGGSAQLSVTDPGVAVVWSPATGLSNPNIANPIATPTVTTVYHVTVTDGSGCQVTDSVTVTVSSINVDAGLGGQVCQGDSVQLQATGGITYSWTPATGLSNPAIANPFAHPATTTTYYVSVTNQAGCSGTDSVIITINPPPAITAGPNSTVCAGECVQLTSAGGLAYTWSPATGLSNPNIANPVACPSQTTTYTVTASGLSGNIVQNGDFSQGNTGFTSDYVFSNNLQPEGRYAVVANANSVHPGFNGNDHTNPPAGNFMVVNGAGTPGVDVWCQTVPVTPNTDYAFSTWVSSVAPGSPASLQFSINGTPLSTPFSAPNTINTWVQFYATWNSGNNTTATICILNQNTNLSGNDFGLDDIVFATFCDGQAQVTITVNPAPVVNAGQDVSICAGDNTQLTGTGGPAYQWSPATGLSSTTVANPTASPASTTTYILTVTNNNNCVNADTVVVTVNPLPIASAGADLQVCAGDSVQLTASGGATYSWAPATGLSNPAIANPMASPATDTQYIVTVDDGNGCQDADTLLVTVSPVPTANAGIDASICQGDTIQLNATGGVSYSWSPATNISNTGIPNPEVWPNLPTTYYVTVTDAGGCTDIDSVFINVFAVIATGDTTVCFGDTAQLGVSPAGTSISWAPALYLNDPSIANPRAFPPVTTTFYVNVTNSGGCVSTDSVVVVVQQLPDAYAGGDVQICEGSSAQLLATGGTSYQWSPATGLSSTTIANPVATPATATTYVVIVSDQLGCSSSDTVTVTPNPLPPADAGPDAAICGGDSTQLNATGGVFYTWTPGTGLSNDTIADPQATPAITTTYTVRVQGPSGQQVVNPGFSGGNTGFSSGYTYNVTTPSSGLYTITTDASLADPSYTGLGHGGSGEFMVVSGNFTYGTDVWCQDFDVAPNTDYYFSAWLSTLVLDDPALLQLAINGIPTGPAFTTPPFGVGTWHEFRYIWNSGSNTSISLCMRNITTTTGPTAFGLDDIIFAPFCENTDQVTITVNPIPLANAGQDVSICIGENTQLTATGGGTYDWTPNATLSSATIANPTATPLNTTTYNVHVTSTDGCEADDQVTVTVNQLPVASAGPDQEFCAGSTVQLNATGGISYQWSPSAGLSNANIANPAANPALTTTYVVTVSDQNQCQDSDTLTITVNQLPVADAGIDQNICLGDTAQLNATGGSSYQWSPGTGLSNAIISNPLAFPLSTTMYTVVVTDNNGCQDSDSTRISIFSITATANQAVCLGDSLQLSVSGGISFVWTPTDGMNNPNISNPLVAPEVTTTYTVTATDANGCEAEAQLTVEVLAAPTAGFTAHYIPSCEGIVGKFTNNSLGAEHFMWVFADGDTSTQENPDHGFNTGPGTLVTLIVYNGEGCTDTAYVDFSGNNYSNVEFDLVVPNVITPNFDDLNDCFRPAFEGVFSECFTLQIYNRWGALIFESIAQGDCWDGTTKAGNLVSPGTYFYILNVNGIEKAGFLTVVHD